MSETAIRLIAVVIGFVIAHAASAGDLLGVTNTGIPAMAGPFGMRWCDDNHLLLNEIQMRGGRPVTLFDVSTMSQTMPALFDNHGNRLSINATVCKGPEILGWREETGLRYLYTGTTGTVGKLVAVLKDFGFVSIASKYLVANTPKVQAGDSYSTDTDCATYHDPDYRLLCRDVWNRRVWLLARYVLTEYTWTEYISVQGPNGRRIQVKNREPMIRRRSGASANGSVLLEDFTGQVLANLSDDPAVTISRYQVIVDRSEQYAYTPCKDTDGFDGRFDSVCRYRLDGQMHQWEKVFTVAEVKRSKGELADVDIAPNGDIYASAAAPAPYGVRGIWRYSAAGGPPRQITRAPLLSQGDRSPRVSPDGRWLAFVRTEGGEKLFISNLRGTRHE